MTIPEPQPPKAERDEPEPRRLDFESAPPTISPAEFGICTANPDGPEHRVIDLGAERGSLRWRCSFCNRSLSELRDGMSIERL